MSFRGRPLVRSGAAPVVAVVVVGILALGEAGLRFCLFHSSSLPVTMKAMNYVANFYGDDTFERLYLHTRLRGHENDPVPATFDPMLGWTARPRTPDNPLGLMTTVPYTLDELRRKPALLFLGDSFVAGVGKPAQAIPYQLGTMLPGMAVINAGVAAYGIDQMYLSLRMLVEHFDHPHVLVGVLYNDVDRVAYAVHASVKPYFELEHGRLVERGVPIPASPRAWLDAYPLPRQLYVASALAGVVRHLASTRWGVEHVFFLHPSETGAERPRKMAVSEALLRALRDECAVRGLPLAVVLFPHVEHIVQYGWYAPWLHRVLDELRIPYLDLTDALRRRVQERHLDWSRDVYQPFAHPSPAENAYFAQHIAAFLRKTYGERFGTIDDRTADRRPAPISRAAFGAAR